MMEMSIQSIYHDFEDMEMSESCQVEKSIYEENWLNYRTTTGQIEIANCYSFDYDNLIK